MEKNPDTRLVWMMPTIFVVMIVVIMIFGHEKDGGWFDRVKEFQTLITGVLAILAAYLTIGQMRKSDERADKRHEDLMKLSTKRERKITDRVEDSYYLLDEWKSEITKIVFNKNVSGSHKDFPSMEALVELAHTLLNERNLKSLCDDLPAITASAIRRLDFFYANCGRSPGTLLNYINDKAFTVEEAEAIVMLLWEIHQHLDDFLEDNN